jgi:hypothetical protein
LSEVQFGVVIPQGWSYDLLIPWTTSQQQQQKQKENDDHNVDNNNNPIKQYEYSKSIAKQLTDPVDLILFIHMIIFFHIMLLIMKRISLNALHYCRLLPQLQQK